MSRVYSYLRFSDPKQAAGSSVERQQDYARRWAAERGLALDDSLSLRDEGLSAYHQRHVTKGALGVFLAAIEAGRVESGSVLIVEGLDRLSRAEPLLAQAQMTQIIGAGVTIVTAQDGREYGRESLRAQPMDLVYSLLVMIRAHEESDTKSKRVRAAIRRQCEAWQAGTWRGVVRVGKDPHWVRLNSGSFVLEPAIAEAMRWAVDEYLAGRGAVEIMREMAARGWALSRSGKLNATHLYKILKSPLLIGRRMLMVDDHEYTLDGYYPALLDAPTWDRLQLAIDRRGKRRGVSEVPGVITGLGIAVCGYCGAAMVAQNLMGRGRQADGRLWDGHRRITCCGYSKGAGCAVPGSISVAPIERALFLWCCNQMHLDALNDGGAAAQVLRAAMAAIRARILEHETALARVSAALVADDAPAPLAFVRQARELERQIEQARQDLAHSERELAALASPAGPPEAARWLELIQGVDDLDRDARIQAREAVRATFRRITIWHAGDPPGEDGVIDVDVESRAGAVMRLRVARR